MKPTNEYKYNTSYTIKKMSTEVSKTKSSHKYFLRSKKRLVSESCIALSESDQSSSSSDEEDNTDENEVDNDIETSDDNENDDKREENMKLDMKSYRAFLTSLFPSKYMTEKTMMTPATRNTIISNISLVIINDSTKEASFKIINDNCYYEDNFDNMLNKNSITKIFLEVINNNYFIMNKKRFNKN